MPQKNYVNPKNHVDNSKIQQKIHIKIVDKNVDMWIKHTILGGCTQNFYQQRRENCQKRM